MIRPALPLNRIRYLLRNELPTIFGPQRLGSYIVNITKTIFMLHLVSEYIGSVRQTAGASMLPTLNVVGDWVYVSKLNRRGRGVQVGDVVSVRHPMFPGLGAGKRVLGMPGDFVLRDTPGRGEGMMVQVPEGHCWLAGDNVPESRDSRDYGPLPLALIKGRVIAKVWPVTEWKWIENSLQSVQKDM